MSEPALFIDFGSTFTKVVLMDLAAETILGRVQSPSTVATDITVGLNLALAAIAATMDGPPVYRSRLATSSAAGGLRLAAIGLVPDLTVEAAKRAALGAGAKVVGVYAFKLTEKEVRELERTAPDMILLAGGTDGGDHRVVAHNAAALGRSSLAGPIVFAGNKEAADEALALLAQGGKEVVLADNVMPEIGVLRVEQVRSIIRELFIRRIVEAKGFKKAEAFIDRILMPTPTAVLAAARLLAEGTPAEPGLGDLVIVDVGGATTDVHSVAQGGPTEPGLIPKGLPEPYVKRTVEGDLGMRYNAATIVQTSGGEGSFRSELAAFGIALDQAIAGLAAAPESLPVSPAEKALDVALARAATRLAMERHAGRIESVYGPHGQVLLQYGKDLRGVRTVIGTGGPLIYGPDPGAVLRETLASDANPWSLKPRQPVFYLDQTYMLYAVGLLAESQPDKALRIAKKYLTRLND